MLAVIHYEDGAMGVFRTREAAEAFVVGDPFVTEDVIVRWRILDCDGTQHAGL